jgi:hypothetical protein
MERKSLPIRGPRKITLLEGRLIPAANVAVAFVRIRILEMWGIGGMLIRGLGMLLLEL